MSPPQLRRSKIVRSPVAVTEERLSAASDAGSQETNAGEGAARRASARRGLRGHQRSLLLPAGGRSHVRAGSDVGTEDPRRGAKVRCESGGWDSVFVAIFSCQAALGCDLFRAAEASNAKLAPHSAAVAAFIPPSDHRYSEVKLA